MDIYINEIKMTEKEKEKAIPFICKCEGRKCEVLISYNDDLYDPLTRPNTCIFNRDIPARWIPKICSNCKEYGIEYIESLDLSYECCNKTGEHVTIDFSCDKWNFSIEEIKEIDTISTEEKTS
jgi:hypothetical protein